MFGGAVPGIVTHTAKTNLRSVVAGCYGLHRPLRSSWVHVVRDFPMGSYWLMPEEEQQLVEGARPNSRKARKDLGSRRAGKRGWPGSPPTERVVGRSPVAVEIRQAREGKPRMAQVP